MELLSFRRRSFMTSQVQNPEMAFACQMLADFLQQKGYFPVIHKQLDYPAWIEVSLSRGVGRRVTIDVKSIPIIIVRVFKTYGVTAKKVASLDLRKPQSLEALAIAVRHSLYGYDT